MYLLGEQPPYIDQLIDSLQTIPGDMLNGLEPLEAPIEIASAENLYSEHSTDRLYFVQQGVVHADIEGRALFYLTEGDLVGLRQGMGLPPCTYSVRQQAILVPYDRQSVFSHIHKDADRQYQFTRYILGQSALFTDALARSTKVKAHPATGFMHVKKGESIIQEGDDADHVYIIMSGHAEAFVKDVKVGDVYKDEVFGAMAVFTNEKRSASVIASEDSTVMTVPQDQFVDLMQTHPRICSTLVENMARTINDLNKQLLEKGQ
ncbi:cyclic nucleotide-binding domain-containing protein [Aestuariirhabdus sp. Z084]|uniref:cyclic nucleotide-binding domain-containing protein n=1 Tax=Aestuariirhabdus haliotis TaxID=2918751 RepID=UPI00201B38A1|nr:cyclic nucleotide-binding domain-containing protein [Aestuariirhabdus haliotis]MCL6417336.1 cyclic nucleotide-binding domain-containing protein [Aestuariirhabdus haliotis]MCL6421281.1 cyclic nucleotide-binding domain-containing protein [Aestuariirhabdus haliotis]